MRPRLSVWLVSTLVLVAMVLVPVQAGAVPSSPTDETKVPHYFGPYPNWANSPLTLPNAQVVISGKNTTPASATATVGANGGLTSITVIDGGSGYTSASVQIIGPGTGATAKATVVKKGAVVDIQVTAGGSGYTSPSVSFTGGGGGSGAAATAYGSVEPTIQIVNGGSGYIAPTVEFDLPDDPNGVRATGSATIDANGVVTAVTVVNPGSGYASAPGVSVLNGTAFDPVNYLPGGAPATVKATLTLSSVVVDIPGSGYTQVPTVVIGDPTGTGAVATASLDNGVVASIAVTKPGSGYVTAGGIKKFTDPLPGLCAPPACPSTPGAKFIPLAVADTTSYTTPAADTYEIGLVQYRTQFSSSMPQGALVRGYVQLENTAWLTEHPGVSQHVELFNELKDGTKVSTGYFGVTTPQWLGPTIVANRDKPVRIIFRNLLPTAADGDLFLPTDTTLMGSGMGPLADQTPPTNDGTVTDGVRNPMCSEYGMAASMPAQCFTQNRATLHLHGGVTPWISDGTPHQWITPAGDTTQYPKGVSVYNVPDMPDPGAGAQTFFYTNQQSARLMFYHDHAWGITRLNVYAGEAAGYLLTDQVEQTLIGNSGAMAGLGLGTPLVIQDRTFVPSDAQLAQQDPTWDKARWGGQGSLWYHHVYMPAQNPGDPSGMSSFGRWMYGPWFWPPASPPNGPIDNPYYNMDPATGFTTPLATPCDLNDPATWQYQTDPFCEPKLIPGTPNISVGMEQFNDTPIVNGTAYPTTTVSPKSYRFRILNAANDRFMNLQWYVADASGTEVALKASEVAAAQTDPNIFPTPDTALSPVGPSWIQIGTEGGFLPAPVVVPNQPITWITDPTRFDVGNVDKHALLLAPAERADTIVDFSAYRGKTLILYNDAPAAFPARVASYDYYTGDPDLSPSGAPSTLPGYGPNTRTIMQVKVANTAAAKPFNMTALNAAFRHHADGSGVFEKDQDPIIVGQAAYNSAYGTNFVSAGWCNAPGATGPAATKCDGYARIQEGNHPTTDRFGFNGLKPSFAPGVGKVQIPFQPKGMHDEMNSASFDEYGRMTANLGLEAPNANPLLQNIILYPFVNPSTELIDATSLPKGDINITPIAYGDDPTTPAVVEGDGTQIWKITHNGVDTHPIHFHLWNVQIINRVTWDNIIIPPDPAELGWKDTVRVSPLEDTIVALRPIIPTLPFDLPNSIRPLNPMMPLGSTLGFNPVDANGDPTVDITNDYTNFGWEYVYHCHILSHEEMDMMRPVSVMLPPIAPSNLAFETTTTTLTWTDNSLSETAFVVQKSSDQGDTWTDLATIDQLQFDLNGLPIANTSGVDLSYVDPSFVTDDQYRIVALNEIGYEGAGGAFMRGTVQSHSAPFAVP